MTIPARRVLGKTLRRGTELPVTIGFVVVLWTLAVTTRSLPHGPRPAVLADIGAGPHSLERLRLFSLLTSAGWAEDLGGYLLATVAALAIGAVVERRWGSIRVLWVALLTQFLGVALGLAVVDLLARWGSDWAAQLLQAPVVGPWPMLVGVAMAVSGGAPPLWRRRIRLGILVVVAALTLYSGLLEDVLRLAAAVVGLLVGRLLPSAPSGPRSLRSTRRETRALVGVLMLAAAVGPILAALSNRNAGPLAALRYTLVSPQISPDDYATLCSSSSAGARCAELTRQLRLHGVGPTILSVLPSVLLAVLSYGLLKGRRFAWWGAVAVQVLLAGLGLVLLVQSVQEHAAHRDVVHHGPFVPATSTLGHLTPLIIPLVLLVMLLLTRWAFDVPAPGGTYRRLLRHLGLAVAALFVVFVLAATVIDGQFSPAPTVWQLIAEFPRRLAPPGYLGLISLDFVPTTVLSTLLFEWTGIALWAFAIGAVIRSFTALRFDDSAADLAEARRILERHGGSALSYLTMWQGNTYWFTPDRLSFVAFRVQSGVAITVGEPIGPPAEMASAMRSFAAYCIRQGWTACFYSTTASAERVGDSLGWPSVQVAEETVLPLGSLAFSGKKFQDIRTAVSRAARAEISAVWVDFPTASADIRAQVIAISREWVATKGLPEMGFTLGGLDEIDDPAVRCLLAIDADGRVHGITSWLPVFRDGTPVGWTLDYMRRRSDGFKGVMEFLISRAALQFQDEGAEFASLSGAPLARADIGRPPTPLQRLLDRTGRSLEPVYGFRSLLHFKAKFQPEYRPLYLIYPESAALPRIGNAISRAYLPHLSLVDVVRLLRKLRPDTAGAVAQREATRV